MSTSAQQVAGEHHIVISLGGEPDKIRQFHAIVGKADSDYPWQGHRHNQMCVRCNGLVWHQPRLNPSDLKSAARQVGGIKLKINRFVHERSCAKAGESLHMLPHCYLPTDVAHKLYRPAGIGEVRAQLHLDEKTKPIVIVPEITNLPALVPTRSE